MIERGGKRHVRNRAQRWVVAGAEGEGDGEVEGVAHVLGFVGWSVRRGVRGRQVISRAAERGRAALWRGRDVFLCGRVGICEGVGCRRVRGRGMSGTRATRPYREVVRARCRAGVVAQVSKPAVSPISKSAEALGFVRVRQGEGLRVAGRSAGLETRDTADLEVCAPRWVGRVCPQRAASVSARLAARGFVGDDVRRL